MGSKFWSARAAGFLLVGCCLALTGGLAVADFCTDDCEYSSECGQDPEDCECPPGQACQCEPPWGSCGCHDRSECLALEWCNGVLSDCNCSVWCNCPQYCPNASELPPCWQDETQHCSAYGCSSEVCQCPELLCTNHGNDPCEGTQECRATGGAGCDGDDCDAGDCDEFCVRYPNKFDCGTGDAGGCQCVNSCGGNRKPCRNQPDCPKDEEHPCDDAGERGPCELSGGCNLDPETGNCKPQLTGWWCRNKCCAGGPDCYPTNDPCAYAYQPLPRCWWPNCTCAMTGCGCAAG